MKPRRSKNDDLPSIERLREFFEYNPITGLVTWRKRPFRSRIEVGEPAGHVDCSGYLITSLDCRKIHVHRIAHALMTGKWTEDEIDHRNTGRIDNHWINLREATHQLQAYNRRARTLIGHKGVCEAPGGKFAARIGKDRKMVYLGVYDTVEQAGAAYAAAASGIAGDFARSA